MSDDDAPKCAASCGRPMRHDTALICHPCASYLRRQLELVAKIAGDITLTVARLDHVGRSGSGRVDDLGWWRAGEDRDPRRPGTNLAVRVMTDRSALPPVAMPARTDAAERHDAAVNVLNTWLRAAEEERGFGAWPSAEERLWPVLTGGRYHPLATTAVCLIHNLEWLRHHPAADECWLDLLTACGQLVRVVDTYVHDKPIIGLCVCRTARHEGEEKCTRCGETALSVDRAQLDEAQHGYHVTASEAAVWIADMGLITDTGKLRKLIWAWADRGHLTPVDDTPRYRFGDVLTRVMASPALRVA